MNYDYRTLGPIVAPCNQAGTDATVTTVLIPPFMGSDGPPLIYQPTPTGARAKSFGPAYTHVTTVCYTNGDTAHTLSILRPKNYSWLTAAIAANGTGVTMYDDPGVYSTNYKWPSPISTGTAQVADNAIAA